MLQTGVELYRAVPVSDPVAMAVPGPLRILAVVASPDPGGGELLDYEAELGPDPGCGRPTRRAGRAYVRVLNWGSPQAIRAALAEERFHVLHISCHAQPGALVLESDTGAAERVDAARFVRDILARPERAAGGAGRAAPPRSNRTAVPRGGHGDGSRVTRW